MRKYVLKWYNIGKVKDIYPLIREKPESVAAKLYPQLSPPGIYLFLDNCKRVIDVGEANPKQRMKLRARIRNEIYANSHFAGKLSQLGMSREEQRELTVKVATVEQGIDSSKAPEEIDYDLHLIERALICETDPWSKSHGGVDNWRKRDEIEIVNKGEYDPLAQIIKRFKDEHCPTRC